jgi:hypothetical protein
VTTALVAMPLTEVTKAVMPISGPSTTRPRPCP